MLRCVKSPSQEGLAVLHLTHEVAEWLAPAESSEPVFARAEVRGANTADLVAAAVQARGTGGNRTRCLLVLGGKLVDSRILALPPLDRSDLAKVLERKAATLLNVERRDALYAAFSLAGEPEAPTNATAEQRWLLLGVRRSLLQPLAAGLQRSRIDIQRVVCGSMARLCEAQILRGETAAPCVVVDVDLNAVVVSLIQGDGLHMQNRIPGSFERTPSMALTLIQELRTFDAYWRKASRGEGVTQVVVIGLDPERSKLFANAIASALPGARTTLCPTQSLSPSGDGELSLAHRRASLAAVRTAGPFTLETPAPTPPRIEVVAAVAGCALVLAAGAGVVFRAGLSRQAQRLRDERVVIESRCADLDRLREENERIEAQVALVLAEAQRLSAARALGVPLDATLKTLLAEVDSRAELRSVALERAGAGGKLRFAALCDSDPLASMRTLKDIEASLWTSGMFDDICVHPPTLRMGLRPDEPLEFAGACSWAVRP